QVGLDVVPPLRDLVLVKLELGLHTHKMGAGLLYTLWYLHVSQCIYKSIIKKGNVLIQPSERGRFQFARYG
ncbi:MAG: hypothetical protein LUO97_00085, partial [Methanomicrobiales archaeon]|nr:hypothetical protein [Methanomicrobiales archaeon]